MKKISVLVFLLLSLNQLVFADNRPAKNKNRIVTVQPFEKLSVAANITVVLYESAGMPGVIIKGKKHDIKKIAVLQKDARLLITSGSNSNMIKNVTVFVPVNNLRSLDITEEAVVRSQNVLESSTLDLEANATSEVHIIVSGKVNIIKGESHSYVRRIRPGQLLMRLAMPVFF